MSCFNFSHIVEGIFIVLKDIRGLVLGQVVVDFERGDNLNTLIRILNIGEGDYQPVILADGFEILFTTLYACHRLERIDSVETVGSLSEQKVGGDVDFHSFVFDIVCTEIFAVELLEQVVGQFDAASIA